MTWGRMPLRRIFVRHGILSLTRSIRERISDSTSVILMITSHVYCMTSPMRRGIRPIILGRMLWSASTGRLRRLPFLTMFLKLLPSVRKRPACMTTSHGSVLPSVRIWDRRLCSVRYGTSFSRTRRMNVITTCRWMLTIIFR